VWIQVYHYENQLKIDSWISFKNIEKEDWVSFYISAYYYSTVTMITVGYGDYKPVIILKEIV